MKRLFLFLSTMFILCGFCLTSSATTEESAVFHENEKIVVPDTIIPLSGITSLEASDSLSTDTLSKKENYAKNEALSESSTALIYKIFSIPAGAIVYLDNDSIGETPCNVEITDSISHTLKLSHAEYKSREFTLSPDTKIKHLNFQLEREMKK